MTQPSLRTSAGRVADQRYGTPELSGVDEQNRVWALLAGRRLRRRRRRGRALAAILARLAGTTAATALLALVGRTFAVVVLTLLAFVACGLSRRASTVTGTAARDLDLAIRDLIGHGRNRGLLLRARRVATTRTRSALVIVALLGGLVGRRIGTRAALGSGARLARCGSTKSVLALLARQMTTSTARGIHATAAVLLLGLLSLALAGGILARGRDLAGITRARALATATATGGLLGLGRLGLAATLTAAAALALALTSTGVSIGIAATALGHRRARQTVGTRQAIAHIDAVLAVELHKR